MTSAYVAIGFSVLFLIILLLLHFLKPEFDPSWRMISEYEIGSFGWMMRLAFFSWGASILALLITIWPSLTSTGGIISRWWMILIVAALFGAGIFKTDPITEITASLVNRLHALCGAIVILTFPIAGTLAAHSLLKNISWQPGAGWLTFVTVLIWLGMVGYFTSVIVARIRNPLAGTKNGPIVYQGWPNRFLAVTYLLWIIVVAEITLRSG